MKELGSKIAILHNNEIIHGDLTTSNFILKDERGVEFELYKSLNQKVLLVFYPKDDTPVCSSQLAEYNENIDEFLKYGIKE